MTVADASPPATFAAMRLSEPLQQALRDVGYETPTSVQSATFEAVAQGRDVIVQSRTGSGKTAAFGIPLLDRVVRPERHVQVLVLCPTRELAHQVNAELARLGKHKGLQVAAVYGGASMGVQVSALEEGVHVVAGTPGRVLDHLRRKTLDVSRLRAVVLDEGDEMLSMGFAEELHAILEFLPKTRQTLLFSATMPESIQRMAQRHLRDPLFLTLSSDHVAPSEIVHYVYFCAPSPRRQDLVRVLELERPEAALVFCNTRNETEVLGRALQQHGLAAAWLSGDLAQADRERVLGDLRSGRVKYLVATDVAARGLDIPHLSHVINFGLPESPENYVHRTGRTGRAGRAGTAVSLVGARDVGALYFLRLTYGIRPIERLLPTAGEERTRRELDRLQLLLSAFPEAPADEAIALARRLLTHEDAERVVASLIAAFFDIGRRTAIERGLTRPSPVAVPAVPVPSPVVAPPPLPAVERPQEPRPERPRFDRPRDDRGPRFDRPRDERPRDDRPREERPRDDRPREDRPRDDRPREDRPRDDRPREGRPPREARPEGFDRGPRAAAVPARAPEPQRRVPIRHGERIQDEDGEDAGMDELRLAVGRADGVRAGDIARMLRDQAQLGRRDVGRISVRDHFSLVNVRAELLEGALTVLKDATLNERPLAPERSRTAAPAPRETPPQPPPPETAPET